MYCSAVDLIVELVGSMYCKVWHMMSSLACEQEVANSTPEDINSAIPGSQT